MQIRFVEWMFRCILFIAIWLGAALASSAGFVGDFTAAATITCCLTGFDPREEHSFASRTSAITFVALLWWIGIDSADCARSSAGTHDNLIILYNVQRSNGKWKCMTSSTKKNECTENRIKVVTMVSARFFLSIFSDGFCSRARCTFAVVHPHQHFSCFRF